jgi:hypothetical protein
MTNTETLPRLLIETVVDQFAGDIEIYEDYSGRGMYGATCFGLTCSGDVIYPFFVELGAEVARVVESGDLDVYDDLAGDLARAARTDSMGRDTIVYFPGFSLD